MSDHNAEGPEEGFVFAATGPKYTPMARRAARNLRHVWPEVAIDLFTDEPVEDEVFDAVHLVEHVTRRPKMEALIRSRFQRSVYLDSDVVAVAPMPEVFDLLRHFDVAGVHEQFGNAPIPMQTYRTEIPISFRQINGGVLGIRKSPGTDAFLREWKRVFDEEDLEFDQPPLRELLFLSDLRLAILPVEYNYMHHGYLSNSTRRMLAPRLLHIPRIHVGDEHVSPADQPFDPAEFLGPGAIRGLQERLETDRTLGARPNLRDLASEKVRKLPLGRRLMRRLAGRLKWI